MAEDNTVVMLPHKRAPSRLPGTKRELLARQAISLRAQGKDAKAVGRELNVGVASLRQMMDIVTLADREDLSDRDKALAWNALERMNYGERLSIVYDQVAPLVARLWGEHMRGSKSTYERVERRRRETFERVVGVAIQACTNAASIDVAHLDADRAGIVALELSLAIRQLQQLRSKIEDMHK